jgi:hypothetical protein
MSALILDRSKIGIGDVARVGSRNAHRGDGHEPNLHTLNAHPLLLATDACCAPLLTDRALNYRKLPGCTPGTRFCSVAARAIPSGMLDIAAGSEMRPEPVVELLPALAGSLSIVAGMVLLNPAGAGTLTYVSGAYALAYGMSIISLAVRMTSSHRPRHPRHAVSGG